MKIIWDAILIFMIAFRLIVEPPGFEPGMTEPKSAVLPLHHGSIPLFKSSANIHSFLFQTNLLFDII